MKPRANASVSGKTIDPEAQRAPSTSTSGEGAGLIRLALSESWRIPNLAQKYRSTVALAEAVFARALSSWHRQGLLPKLGDPNKAATLALSMLSDPARIRTALGDPMTKAEIDAHAPYAVDMFLRACGYKEARP